jgi:D-xylose 1-dehydrogenase (NADP+, D-xylono-1,5-lactone-forming)
MTERVFEPVRIGILGAAKIARAFVTGVEPSSKVKIVAVASRSPEKAQAFATEYAIPTAHGSYEALLADPNVEAIYNPLPNNLHAEWTIAAAKAGKHILCEKPLAVTEREAKEMFAAAWANKVRLAEAYPYRSQPQTLKVTELVRSGAIGRLQVVHAAFGITFTDPANIRLNPELGGGALLDAGSYPVSFVRMVSGERPTRVSAIARWHDSGVDMTTLATIEHASGLVAQVSASFATSYHRHATIAGDRGTIATNYLNHPPIGGPPEIVLRRGIAVTEPTETIVVPSGNGFLAEAESFAAAVRLGPSHWNGASEAESIDIMATLEAIALASRTGKPVDISALAT